MKIFATRLGFSGIHAEANADPFGIRCIGVEGDDDEVPLLLVADTDENEGASATNIMHRLLPVLAAEWATFPIRSAIVLEQDSMGLFDFVLPTWLDDSRQCTVTFAPLRYPAVPPRSREAFVALYGSLAVAALARLD